jgi:hypothetical protein
MFCPVRCSSEAGAVCSCSEQCFYHSLNFVIVPEARAMLACQVLHLWVSALMKSACVSALLPFLRAPLLQLTNMCLPI